MTVRFKKAGIVLRTACAEALRRHTGRGSQPVRQIIHELDTVGEELRSWEFSYMLSERYEDALTYMWAALKRVHELREKAILGLPLSAYANDLQLLWGALSQMLYVMYDQFAADNLLAVIENELEVAMLAWSVVLPLRSLDIQMYVDNHDSVETVLPIGIVLGCIHASETLHKDGTGLFGKLFTRLLQNQRQPLTSASILAMFWCVRKLGGECRMARDARVRNAAFNAALIQRHVEYALATEDAQLRDYVSLVAADLI